MASRKPSSPAPVKAEMRTTAPVPSGLALKQAGTDASVPACFKANPEGTGAVVRISALTGAGLDGLRDAIRKTVLREDFEPGDSAVVTRLRHQTSLQKAREALANAAASAEGKLSGEFVAMDLRAGLDALGEITGVVTTDDILDRIFRDFCIGK